MVLVDLRILICGLHMSALSMTYVYLTGRPKVVRCIMRRHQLLPVWFILYYMIYASLYYWNKYVGPVNVISDIH